MGRIRLSDKKAGKRPSFLHKFIKTCRIDAGLRQEQLAKKMGVSVVSVQNWESGKTRIKNVRINGRQKQANYMCFSHEILECVTYRCRTDFAVIQAQGINEQL